MRPLARQDEDVVGLGTGKENRRQVYPQEREAESPAAHSPTRLRACPHPEEAEHGSHGVPHRAPFPTTFRAPRGAIGAPFDDRRKRTAR
jgi:hypothetical protein